jgi:hypothetical protein
MIAGRGQNRPDMPGQDVKSHLSAGSHPGKDALFARARNERLVGCEFTALVSISSLCETMQRVSAADSRCPREQIYPIASHSR